MDITDKGTSYICNDSLALALYPSMLTSSHGFVMYLMDLFVIDTDN